MKFSYQVGTPDLKISPNVTCMQGDFAYNMAKLSEYGYDAVELMSTYPKSLDWHKIKQILDDCGLSASLICTGELGLLGFNISDPDDALRRQGLERIKELIDVAEFFGVGINIGNTKGRYIDHVPHEETYARALEGFRELCDYAQPKNVPICIETGAFVYINFLNTCAEVAEMIEKVDRKNLGIMLDLFHLQIEEKNMLEAIRRYAPICQHVHLADNNRKYPGAGGHNFREIIESFHAADYDGAFSVEVRQVPDSHTAARLAANTLVPIFSDVYGWQK